MAVIAVRLDPQGLQDVRPLSELLFHGEWEALVSRIADAVEQFFKAIVQLITESWDWFSFKVISLLPEQVGMWLDPAKAFCIKLKLRMSEAEVKPFYDVIKDMRETDQSSVIEKLSAIPDPEKEQLVRSIPSFISDYYSSYQKTLIIDSLVAIPAAERESVIRNALPLINPAMDSWNKISVIEAIALVQAVERESVIRNALLLINPAMDNEDRSSIIETIARIPAAERESVIRNALLLIIPAMDSAKKASIIGTICAIPAAERESVTALAQRVITNEMSGFEIQNIVRAITNIPIENRATVIERALPGIRAARWAFQMIWEIENRAREIPNERRDFIRRMEQGVDVHDGNRDPQLRAALELFHAHQGALTEDEILAAQDEFIAYLAEAPITQEVRTLAHDALLKERGIDEVFGPLIDEIGFSIYGLRVKGAELIGRLWIYVSNLQGADQTNAKSSMISALRKSYNDWGGRVCNPGKTHRLVIGVLQGRLAGVNVDDVAMQVTVAQAIEMFFSVRANQEIDNLAQLLAAANQFCDNNPAAPREDFMREIHAYAQQQEMI
jgi:hypothetical protein